MKFKEVAAIQGDDLLALEDNLRQELSEVSFQARMGQLANTSRIGALRKDIARVMTAKTVKKLKGRKNP